MYAARKSGKKGKARAAKLKPPKFLKYPLGMRWKCCADTSHKIKVKHMKEVMQYIKTRTDAVMADIRNGGESASTPRYLLRKEEYGGVAKQMVFRGYKHDGKKGKGHPLPGKFREMMNEGIPDIADDSEEDESAEDESEEQ